MKFNLRTSLALGALITTGLVASSAMARHPGGPGHLFDRFDANNDGKVTRTEARTHAEKKFKEVDANNDKVVTPDEMKKHHEAKKAERPDPAKHVEEKIKSRDKNKNGKIDRDEAGKLPAEVFKKIDTNKDGALSKDELLAAHKKRMAEGGKKGHHDKRRGPGGDGHFKKIDTSGDGKISSSEAKGAVDRVFSRIDKNKDNVVTKAEVGQMRPKHQCQGPQGKDGPKKNRPRHHDKRK